MVRFPQLLLLQVVSLMYIEISDYHGELSIENVDWEHNQKVRKVQRLNLIFLNIQDRIGP